MTQCERGYSVLSHYIFCILLSSAASWRGSVVFWAWSVEQQALGSKIDARGGLFIVGAHSQMQPHHWQTEPAPSVKFTAGWEPVFSTRWVSLVFPGSEFIYQGQKYPIQRQKVECMTRWRVRKTPTHYDGTLSLPSISSMALWSCTQPPQQPVRISGDRKLLNPFQIMVPMWFMWDTQLSGCLQPCSRCDLRTAQSSDPQYPAPAPGRCLHFSRSLWLYKSWNCGCWILQIRTQHVQINIYCIWTQTAVPAVWCSSFIWALKLLQLGLNCEPWWVTDSSVLYIFKEKKNIVGSCPNFVSTNMRKLGMLKYFLSKCCLSRAPLHWDLAATVRVLVSGDCLTLRRHQSMRWPAACLCRSSPVSPSRRFTQALMCH